GYDVLCEVGIAYEFDRSARGLAGVIVDSLEHFLSEIDAFLQDELERVERIGCTIERFGKFLQSLGIFLQLGYQLRGLPRHQRRRSCVVGDTELCDVGTEAVWAQSPRRNQLDVNRIIERDIEDFTKEAGRVLHVKMVVGKEAKFLRN